MLFRRFQNEKQEAKTKTVETEKSLQLNMQQLKEQIVETERAKKTLCWDEENEADLMIQAKTKDLEIVKA